jgi:hypothetical protein
MNFLASLYCGCSQTPTTDFTATPKGHVKMRRQGLQSTKSTTPPNDDDFIPTAKPTLDLDIFQSTEQMEYVCLYKMHIPLTQENTSPIYGGPLPLQIFYRSRVHANHVLHGHELHPLRDHDSTNWRRICTSLPGGYHFLQGPRHNTPMGALDNETTSRELTGVARKLDIKIQYLPPHNHRASKAEQAIQTWKGHFISVLCMTHPEFPWFHKPNSHSTYCEAHVSTHPNWRGHISMGSCILPTHQSHQQAPRWSPMRHRYNEHILLVASPEQPRCRLCERFRRCCVG